MRRALSFDVRDYTLAKAMNVDAEIGEDVLLLIAIIGGVAAFCFLHGYIVIGVVCLLGFSKKIGWPALLLTSSFLFWTRHWFVALLPLVLIAWNIWGLRFLTPSDLTREQERARK